MKLKLELTHPLVRAIDELVTPTGHVMLTLNAYDKNWNPIGKRTLLEIDSWTVRNSVYIFNLTDHEQVSRDLAAMQIWQEMPGETS